MKNLLINSVIVFEFDFSFNAITHRVYIRKIRKQLIKQKKLIIKRCIDVKIILNEKRRKTKLNCDSEVNLISRQLIKKLDLFFFTVVEPDARIVDNNKLQIFDVHFLLISVLNINDVSRFFEEFFMKVSMQNDLILEMLWFSIAKSQVSWINKSIKWPRNSITLSTTHRVDVLDSNDFAEEIMNDDNVVYVFHIWTVVDDMKNVHSSRKIQVSLAAAKKLDEAIEIPKAWLKHSDIFDDEKTYQLPKHDSTDHVIDLKKSKTPSYDSIYSLFEKELKVLKQYIDRHLIIEFIRFFTFSVDVSILFVKKKDGDLRLCVNYRGLNLLTIKNRYLLSFIEESINRFSKVKIYTRLNITAAYHRLKIRKGDEWKTTFRTRYGHFEYQVLLFDFTNALASFQVYINRILTKKLNVCVIVYLNDIIVYSKTLEQHDKNVCWVLKQLRLFSLYVARSKCQFQTNTIDFVNFRVSIKRVQMMIDKLEVIRSWPRLTSMIHIMQFIDFANFYKRFIRNFFKIVAPFIEMLKNNSNFRKSNRRRKRGNTLKGSVTFLSKEASEIFETLKEAFMTVFVLRHFDSAKFSRVEIDAFDKVIEAILSQQDENDHWHFVAYLFRKMISTKNNYEIHDKELLIIIDVFKHWRHYLEEARHEVLVLTNHNNLRKFMKITKLSSRQIRWVQKLSRYNFVIDYRLDTKNSANDLFRRSNHMNSTVEEVDVNRQILKQLQQSLHFDHNSDATKRVAKVKVD